MNSTVENSLKRLKIRIYSCLEIVFSVQSNCGITQLPAFLKNYFFLRKEVSKNISSIKEKYEIANPGVSYQKYMDIDYWLFENLRRAYVLGLHKMTEKIAILDIGTGPGYFPFICGFYGHDAEALDVPDNEMYNEMKVKLGIKRYDQRILPFRNLDIYRKYDLITAFMICFNNHQQPDLWHIREWEHFINSLFSRNLHPGGEVVLSFNAETPQEPISKELLSYFIGNGAKVDGNTVFLKSNYAFCAGNIA